MTKIIQEGDYATLIQEKLTDDSFVFNVMVEVIRGSDKDKDIRIELLCKDEEAAQKLFNTIEESCIGLSY